MAQEDMKTLTGFQDNGTDVVGTDTFSDAMSSEAFSLAKFLERPVKIIDILSTSGTSAWWPLELLLSNTAIVRILSNYKGLTGTLNLRFQQAGNPFTYGLEAWYIRYELEGHTNSLGASVTSLPHILMDPSVTQPCEMKVPIIWLYEYLNLRAPSSTEGGERHIRLGRATLAPYQLANSVSVPEVGITVFAWLTDVRLVGTVPANITLQSSEYTGVVSKPASIVSDIAGKLVDFPIIGTFAKATNIGAKAVASIFSLFGMSKPININPPMAMYGQPHRNMYTSEGLDVANKLTIDAKQENVLSPVILSNTSLDPLAHKNIAGRYGMIYSYLNATMVWNTTDAVNTILKILPVSPGLITQSGGAVSITPVGMTCIPYKYWRGQLKFRVRPNCSQFHRGRLRVFWSPNPLVIPITEELSNIVESCIIDISNDKCVDLVVNWGSVENFKRFGLITYNTTLNIASYPTCNGYLYFQVLQPLQAPIAGNIMLTVEMAAGDDFATAVPSWALLNSLHFTPWADVPLFVPPPYPAMTPTVDSVTTFDSTPRPAVNLQSGEYNGPEPKAPSLCYLNKNNGDSRTILARQFGEAFDSFRPMIKAYQPFDNQDWDNQSYYMYDAYADITSQNGSSMILRSPTWIGMLSSLFYARRGGIRYKFQFNTQSSENQYITAFRTRDLVRFRSGLVNITDINQYRTMMDLQLNGMAISEEMTCPTLTVEMPVQLPTKFMPAAPYLQGSANIFNTLQISSDHIFVYAPPQTYTVMSTYVAAAEDFTLDVFNGIPLLYFWYTKLPVNPILEGASVEAPAAPRTSITGSVSRIFKKKAIIQKPMSE